MREKVHKLVAFFRDWGKSVRVSAVDAGKDPALFSFAAIHIPFKYTHVAHRGGHHGRQ